MTYQPDLKVNCANAAIIHLAGQDWFVPELAMRQNRVVVPRAPALLRMSDRLVANDLGALDEAGVDDLATVVHAALTRAYPQLSWDEFLDLPIGPLELVKALPVVLQQSGFFVRKDADTGEVEGAPTVTTPQST